MPEPIQIVVDACFIRIRTVNKQILCSCTVHVVCISNMHCIVILYQHWWLLCVMYPFKVPQHLLSTKIINVHSQEPHTVVNVRPRTSLWPGFQTFGPIQDHNQWKLTLTKTVFIHTWTVGMCLAKGWHYTLHELKVRHDCFFNSQPKVNVLCSFLLELKKQWLYSTDILTTMLWSLSGYTMLMQSRKSLQ